MAMRVSGRRRSPGTASNTGKKAKDCWAVTTERRSIVKRNSSRPSPSVINRDWPHQVALPDDLCVMRNHALIDRYCAERGFDHIKHQVTAIWPNQHKHEFWRLHCFQKKEQALAFQTHFGGYLFDPKKDREGGKVRGVWLREGEYQRMLESGPLSVPEVLRR